VVTRRAHVRPFARRDQGGAPCARRTTAHHGHQRRVVVDRPCVCCSGPSHRDRRRSLRRSHPPLRRTAAPSRRDLVPRRESRGIGVTRRGRTARGSRRDRTRPGRRACHRASRSACHLRQQQSDSCPSSGWCGADPCSAHRLARCRASLSCRCATLPMTRATTTNGGSHRAGR